jgi:AMP nucleosidase
MPILPPDMPVAEAFTEARAAVDRLCLLYERGTRFL